MSRPTAGAISQFRVPRLLILPSQTAPLALQAHPQVSVVLQCGPPRQGSDTQCGTGVLPSLPFQFPLVKVLHLPSSKGTEGPGWGWGCGYRGHSGPPLTLPLRPSSPERQSCLTCQAPQLRGLGANLVTHGFLVLLVGGFHRGSGGANVDLGRRGGSGSRVFAIMEQVSHQRELETNRGRRWRTRALELYAACTLSTFIFSFQTTPESCPVPPLAPQSHHRCHSITTLALCVLEFHMNGVTWHTLLRLRSFTNILSLISIHIVACISGSFSSTG